MAHAKASPRRRQRRKAATKDPEKSVVVITTSISRRSICVAPMNTWVDTGAQPKVKAVAADALADLSAFAQPAIKDGHVKDAADLLRASEHLSLLLARETSGIARVSAGLKHPITEQSDGLT